MLAYNHGSAVEAYRTPALYITATQITSSTGRGIDVDNTDLFLAQATVGVNAAGGISTWSGILSINDSTIVGNRGNEGAGIYSVWGSVIMTDTKLLGNHAGLNGGAAYVSVGGRELTLTRTTVSGNTGPYGAGIYLAGGDLQIKASNILANVGEHGPAIYFSSLHDAVVTEIVV